MTIEELNQAFQNLSDNNDTQDTATVAQETVQQSPEQLDSYLTYDNVDKDFGNWYKHDKDIGAILMDQLKANDVDTRDATEAALREVLTDLTGRLQVLTDVFSDFKTEVDSLKNQTAQVTSAVEDTLHAAGATTSNPVDSATMPIDIGAQAPDINAIAPPVSLPVDNNITGTDSDNNKKEDESSKVTLSDKRLKNIKVNMSNMSKAKKESGTPINSSFADICSWR